MEVIIDTEKPVKGKIRVHGDTSVVPKCHPGQTAHQNGQYVSCKAPLAKDVDYDREKET